MPDQLEAVAAIEALWVRGDDVGALAYADEVWAAVDCEPAHPAHAEVARFARLAAYRAGSPKVDAWQAHAIEAAVVTGNVASLCLSLQPYFFRALGSGRMQDAHRCST